MATFPLSSLYPDLLSQVITKLDSISYFRFQKTCTGAGEFIRSSRISVHLPAIRSYTLQFDEEKNSFHFIISSNKIIAVKDLYGTRLGQFKSYAKAMTEHFENVCEMLKKNRITAKWILVPQGLSRDQCAVLLQILKPVEVAMNTEGTDQFEALFSTKTISQVKVTVKQDNLADVMPKLVSKFSDVEMNIGGSGTNLTSLLGTILTILRKNHSPALRRFAFTVYGDWDYTSDELEEVFRQLKLSEEKYPKTQGRIYANMDMSSDFPSGASCKVIIFNSLHILYRSS